jgi:hypothetical protein
MNLAAVMDDLGLALETVPELRVAPYWTDRINPPMAIVGWPEPLTFDATFGRGSDRTEIPVYVAVGRNDARSARDRLARYADGSGEHSVKAAVESHEATSYDSARVIRVEFDVLTVASVDYLAATFYVDLVGRGAA